MQIRHFPDADILLIELKDGELSDSKDIAEQIIVHYSLKNEPLETAAPRVKAVVPLKIAPVGRRPERPFIHPDTSGRSSGFGIEIPDASKLVSLEDVDISWKELLTQQLSG